MRKLLSVITMLALTGTANFLWAGTPNNGMPANGVPSNGIPDNGVPNNGIPKNGDSKKGTNPNGISKNGVSEEVSNKTTIGSATSGAGAGKTKFNEFVVKKSKDKSNAVLSKKAGDHDSVHSVEGIKHDTDVQNYPGDGAHPDKHSRIKVKLNWDRAGKKDDFGKVKSDSNHIGSNNFGGGVSTHLSTHDKTQLTQQLNGDGHSLSTANQVSKVKVRGYDPALKKNITGGSHRISDGTSKIKADPGPMSKTGIGLSKTSSFQKINGLPKANGLRKTGMGDGSLVPAVQK